MKYVYGPVPSRRLGQSLGIDPIPLKTCNWNCVYCQLGRTRPLVNKRIRYSPQEEILAQVKDSLDANVTGEIDWVTFVGSDEPTLHIGIGWMIHQVKALTDIPVAVITNGALLHLPSVREELSAADAVLPSLDDGTVKLFCRINRPLPEITFKRHLRGLISFSRNYTGLLWPEVMLVRDLNDTEEALREIANAFHQIQPDEVHIGLPTRPPAEVWVQPSDEEGLMRASAIMGDITRVIYPVEGSFDLSEYESVIDAVIGIITRHPMREEELKRALALWAPGEVSLALSKLEAGGQAQMIERYGARFWSSVSSFFPDKAHSKITSRYRRW